MPGPVRKKDAERRRRNVDAVPTEIVNVDAVLAGEVEIPTPSEEWHPVALQIWEAQVKSGQVIWMEPSDWALLYMICESISRDMNPQVIGISEETGKPIKASIPLKGASLSSYLKAANMLLMAEGGRRTLRIELERQKRLDAAMEGEGKVVDIVSKRRELFG